MKQLAVIQCTRRSNAGKAHQHAPGPPGLDPHHAAGQIEEDEQRKHAEDRNGADPAQRDLMEVTPIAAGGLLDGAGLLVGDGAAAGNPAELVEQLVFRGPRSRSD